MKVAVRFTKKEEVKAVPILMRHSPGMMLPGNIYVISADAADVLRKAGVRFTELANDVVPQNLEGAAAGERI